MTSKVNAKCKRRLIAEEKVLQSCNEQADLQAQLRQQADVSTLLKEIAMKYAADVNKAILVLQGPRKQMT
jgi:hypothetical protein